MLKLDEEMVWTKRRIHHLQEMSGLAGKTPGESVITSMGTTGPPAVERPVFILDYLVSDGAQVTRPSIDPYREPIETQIYLANMQIRISMPVILAITSEVPKEYIKPFVRAAYNMGILTYLHDVQVEYSEIEDYQDSIITPLEENQQGDYVAYVGTERKRPDKPLFFRIPSTEDRERIAKAIQSEADAILIDEDLSTNTPLEVAVSFVDRFLKEYRIEGEPLRSRVGVIACSSRIRGADDVFKLMGLGADCVVLSKAALIATGLTAGKGKHDTEAVQDMLENFFTALQKEIKLLAGAAGISCLYTSLVGSRELFRAITLDRAIREKLGVKMAGVG